MLIKKENINLGTKYTIIPITAKEVCCFEKIITMLKKRFDVTDFKILKQDN